MQIRGKVKRIIFSNPQNGWTVALIQADSKHITVVGNMPKLNIGEIADFEGEYGTHKTFGEQFAVNNVSIARLEKVDEIYNFLSSKIIKGIGEAMAKKIVDSFGEASLNIIADEPEKLAKIKGISLKKAFEISESYAKQVGSRDVVMFLQKFGISVASSLKIYEKYKTAAISRIKENPYILCNVRGIGFATADNIARQLEFPPNFPWRIYYGLLSVMHNATLQGHTYAPLDAVVKNSCAILNLPDDEVRLELDRSVQSGKLILHGENLFLPVFDAAESNVADRLKKIIAYKPKKIEKIIVKNDIKLDKDQQMAVKLACENNFLIITGGPGTGKTTIIKTLIDTFENAGLEIELSAPTGRAAKRISEVTGREGRTIHRLLEIERMLDDDTQIFFRDEYNPLDCDVLIVDEASMLDLQLASSLFRAVRNSTRVILVGDVDQLPPVGAGDVLRDAIKSEQCPVAFLTEIYRQAQKSHIVVNAHRVNNGQELLLEPTPDFEFIELADEDEVLNEVIKLAEKAEFLDTQILSPMRRGNVGVGNLNVRLQEVLNVQDGSKNECKIGANVFREGDKVMQIKNNYSIEWQAGKQKGTGVFNGDIGIISEIDKENEKLIVIFDEDKETDYEPAKLQELELAYATTVHKSQGSEYSCVILPIFNVPPMLLTRNLLYTAMTRAKQKLYIIGQRVLLDTMIANLNTKKRYSSLCSRLKDE